ncbi:MAG: C40 family peptidase [Chthoniobacterales bacterium]|nr:C40 family peptidase [Chthoniobacterales bacterium]
MILPALCVALVVILTPTADAKTRRREKPSALKVALAPLKLARSAVHAAAEPIVHNVPRLAFEAATAPVRIAYRAAHEKPQPPRRAPGGDESSGDLPVYSPRRAALNDDRDNDAIQVAYVVPRAQPVSAPRAEPVERDDEEASAEAETAERDDEEISTWTLSGSKPMVNGSRAILRNGIAYAPSRAPQAVKNAIWAANTLRKKPYIWGGGHDSFYDRGYDCSGTVSFALHGAGAIRSPMPSSDLRAYGERGCGRWFTIYSRSGHTFAVIAGLRLDTTDFQGSGNSGPRWHAEMRDARGYVARHPAGL